MTGAETFGAISLVPPLLAIVLAIVTRKPILSLFLGIWSGGVIFTTSHGVAQTLDWLVSSIGESTFNAKIMLIVLFLGAGVALIWRLGGANAIANTVTSSLDDPTEGRRGRRGSSACCGSSMTTPTRRSSAPRCERYPTRCRSLARSSRT